MSAALPSLAQTLPRDVLEIIINHRVDAHNFTSCRDGPGLFSILRACQSWRAAFIERCYKEATIHIREYKQIYMAFSGWPSFLCHPYFPYWNSVRTLKFDILPWRILKSSNDVLTILLESTFANAKFPMASNVVLKITSSYHTDTFRVSYDPLAVFKNILSLVCQIKTMVPAIASFGTELDNIRFDSLERQALGLIRSGFAEAFDGISSISSFAPRSSFVDPAILYCNISGLVSLSLYIPREYADLAELVKKNAPTLKSVSINFYLEFDTSSILYDSQGAPVLYPLVQTLNIIYVKSTKLDNGHVVFNEPRSSDTTVAHFPCLRWFKFWGNHLLCGGALLNGTSDTLEYIDIIISSSVIRALDHCNYFSANRFPRLENLQLRTHILDKETIPVDSHNEFIIQTIKNLDYLPNVQILFICFTLGVEQFNELADNPQAFNSISHLNVTSMRCTFVTFTTILRCLPCLVKIKCYFSDSDPILSHNYRYSPDEYMETIPYPLNKCFTTLVVPISLKYTSDLLVRAIALIALVCPKFYLVYSMTNKSTTISESVKKLASFSEFMKHKERLKSIKLYNST